MLIAKMELAEKRGDFTGAKKKEWVMVMMQRAIEAQWGKAEWDKYKDVLGESIDFVIALSKHKKLLSNINKRCWGGGWCGFCIN